MKHLFLFLLLLPISFQATAQHCPFDNTGVIVVKVVAQNAIDQINILQPVLTYLDNNKKPVEVRFTLNRRQTNEYLRDANSYDITALHFDFAEDYFIAPIPMDKAAKAFIHLEDEQGNVVQKKQALDENLVFDLHENHGHNWSKFSEKFTPEPLNPFDQLTTILAHSIEIPQNLLFEVIGNQLNLKYGYSNRVTFDNQKDLDEVIRLSPGQKIDFAKSMVVFQRFDGDCLMRVNLYQVVNPAAKTITLKAFHYEGGCRAGGSASFLTVVPKPKKNMEVLFEVINSSEHHYLIKH